MINRKYGLRSYKDSVLVPVSIILVLSVFITGSLSVQVSMGKLSSIEGLPSIEDCRSAIADPTQIGTTPIAKLFIATCLLYFPEIFPSGGGTFGGDIERVIEGLIPFI